MAIALPRGGLRLLNKVDRGAIERSFTEFYVSYERLIRSTLFNLLGSGEPLDDLVQATFMKAWESRDRFEGRSKLETWIVQIAVNLAKDQWRKSGRALEAPFEDEQDAKNEERPDPTQELDHRMVLEQALRGLDFEHRAVIALHYFQDHSIEEIALLLQLPAGTVKSRLHHAKSRLREKLQKMGVKL